MKIKDKQVQCLNNILNANSAINSDEAYAHLKLRVLIEEADNMTPAEIMEFVWVTGKALMSNRYKLGILVFGNTALTIALWDFYNDKQFSPKELKRLEKKFASGGGEGVKAPAISRDFTASQTAQKTDNLQKAIVSLKEESAVLEQHVEVLESQIKEQKNTFKAEFDLRAELDYRYYRLKQKVRQLEDMLTYVKKHGAANIDLLALEGITGDVVLTESDTSSVYSDYGSSVGEWSYDEDSDSGSIKNYGV